MITDRSNADELVDATAELNQHHQLQHCTVVRIFSVYVSGTILGLHQFASTGSHQFLSQRAQLQLGAFEW